MEDYVRDANELRRPLEGREPAAVRDPERAGAARTRRSTAQNQANELGSESATLADRARDIDVPDELSKAHGLLPREPRAPP